MAYLEILQSTKVIQLIRMHKHIYNRGFWDNKRSQLSYLEWLADTLNFQELDRWYTIQTSHFMENYGLGFLEYWEGRAKFAIQCLYPSHNWQPWKFEQVKLG
jgi:hypothetical protein